MSLPFPFPPLSCTKPQSTLVCFCYLSTYSTFSLPLNTFCTSSLYEQIQWNFKTADFPVNLWQTCAKLLILACIWNKIEVISTANIGVLTVLFSHFIVTVAIYFSQCYYLWFRSSLSEVKQVGAEICLHSQPCTHHNISIIPDYCTPWWLHLCSCYYIIPLNTTGAFSPTAITPLYLFIH